jgi:monooxygenase
MDQHNFAIAVPRKQADISAIPFLSFSSGYVQRATDLLPQQGSRRPWQVYQNYFMDMLTIRYSKLDDGVLQFSPKPDKVESRAC